MKHISLFSGVGGFDLAAQWMGWENVAHCEINPFCRKVLKYYWPNAISYENIISTVFSVHRGTIDVLTGGFPCQPYSVAGKRLGKEDERHLWPTCLEQFGRYDQHGSWARMFPALLVGMEGWFSRRCRLTWKLKGTKYNRLYFQLAVSTLPTEGIECGLLPAPTVMYTREDWTLEDIDKKRKEVKENTNSRTDGMKTGNGFGLNLSQVARMLPTPTASSDAKGGCTRKEAKRQNDTLAHSIHGMMGEPGKTSQLNPRFVAEVMGFPPDWLELPFQNTELNQSKPTAMQ